MEPPAGDGKPKFRCGCGKEFQRKEHLKRHEATHARPNFICQTCQRGFSRSDILRRHAQLHETPSVPESRKGRACDACREKKTRCTGGIRCSLCTKRNVDCTYGQALRQPPGVTEPNTESCEQTHSAPESQPAGVSSQEDRPSFHNTTSYEDWGLGDRWAYRRWDYPYQTTSHPAGSSFDYDQTVQMGLRHILNSLPKHRVDMAAFEAGLAGQTGQVMPDEYQTWLHRSMDVFFGRFHERWPLLHVMALDERTSCSLLVASVGLIGTYTNCSRVEDLVIKVHTELLTRLFGELNELLQRGVDDVRPWPQETCQAAVLNTIFAFETGRSVLIEQAQSLLHLLISAIKKHNILDPRIILAHQQKHFPGNYRPFIYGYLETWKRIVAFTFRLDTYLALFRNGPPRLGAEELTLPLQSAYSVWNGWGIDVFWQREAEQPGDREVTTMADMCKGGGTLSSAPSPLRSGYLIEDVQMGLCALWPSIYRYTQQRRKFPFSRGTLETQRLLEAGLNRWKTELEHLAGVVDRPDLHRQRKCDLLKAYAGREDPNDPNYHDILMRRIAYGVFNTRMLYSLLGLYIYADVSVDWGKGPLDDELGDTGSQNGFASPVVASLASDLHMADRPLPQRPTPSLHRYNVVRASSHALQLLKAYQAIVPHPIDNEQTIDAIGHMAVVTAIEYAWDIYSSPESLRPCAHPVPTMQSPRTASNSFSASSSCGLVAMEGYQPDPGFLLQVLHACEADSGQDACQLDSAGGQICRCSILRLLENLAETLNLAGSTWEQCRNMAAALESRLQAARVEAQSGRS